MAYRVSRTPAGDKRWWYGDETVPEMHTDVRDASPAEVVIIDQLAAYADKGHVPGYDLCQAFAAAQ